MYYTPSPLVRHLVERAVAPAFERHLDQVRKTAETDPESAADQLLDFAVLDPACGSAHFLVEVLDRLADLTARFLGNQPLPAIAARMETLRAAAGSDSGIRDMTLLRRLLLKHCIYGVDVSPMGVEIATLSLWLAAFVPGLSLSYLGRNVIRGNSLLGVADRETVVKPHAFESDELRESLKNAAEAAAELADNPDRTPEEYDQSSAADHAAQTFAAGAKRLFDLWTAEAEVSDCRRYLGVGAKRFSTTISTIVVGSLYQRRRLRPAMGCPSLAGRLPPCLRAGAAGIRRCCRQSSVGRGHCRGTRHLCDGESRTEHASGRISGSWRSPNSTNRIRRCGRVLREKGRARTQRRGLGVGEYEGSPGDPDLYKYFCQRYRKLLRADGAFGVVLPRTAFSAKGSAKFREWLYGQITVDRVDFLVNTKQWAFDSTPKYTIALLAARNRRSPPSHRAEFAGTADSPEAWRRQVSQDGVGLAAGCFGPEWETPLVRSQDEADLLERVRRGSRFPLGSGSRWWCFPVAELHETNDRPLWLAQTSGLPLWKGASFGPYEPRGTDGRHFPQEEELLRRKLHKRSRAAAHCLDESPKQHAKPRCGRR